MSKARKDHRRKVAARNQRLAHENMTSVSGLNFRVAMNDGKAANEYLDRMCKKRRRLPGEKSPMLYRLNHK